MTKSCVSGQTMIDAVTRDTVFVYVFTHVCEFPINTILAWIIDVYHEQGNMIITNLLLPLGHTSNISPMTIPISFPQSRSPQEHHDAGVVFVASGHHSPNQRATELHLVALDDPDKGIGSGCPKPGESGHLPRLRPPEAIDKFDAHRASQTSSSAPKEPQ